MNLSSLIVIGVVALLAALAAWRTLKKGAPCECGGSGKACSCKDGSCHCCGK